MLKRILLIFGYIGFTLMLMALTAGLVAYGNDYTYDFASGQIIQKGHVIINSLPSGVRVTEDGKQLKKNTPFQAAVKVGDHKYQLSKDGFVSWEKVLHVVAGRVALASYVILMPQKPVTTVLDNKTQIVAQAMSKDHRHLAYISGGADAAVYTLDFPSKKITKVYTPKAAEAATATAPATAAETLKDVSWSDDASHLLISSDLAGAPQYRLATAGSTEMLDLTQTFGANLREPKFAGNNWRQLYWISPEGLRRIDIDSSTISAVLADKVTQFWVQPDRVLYVQQTDLGRSLRSLERGGKHDELIPALAESDSYIVTLSHYKNEDELVVVPSKTGVATLYSGIFGDTPVSKVIAHDVTAAAFASNGYKVALSSAKSLTVYDLERTELDQTSVEYHIDYPDGLTTLNWFDNDHLLSGRGGQVYWSEFDGANAVSLGKSALLPAYSDSDNRSVYFFAPTDKAVQITQLQIR